MGNWLLFRRSDVVTKIILRARNDQRDPASLVPKLRLGTHSRKLCFESKRSFNAGVPKRSLGTRKWEPALFLDYRMEIAKTKVSSNVILGIVTN